MIIGYRRWRSQEHLHDRVTLRHPGYAGAKCDRYPRVTELSEGRLRGALAKS